MMIRSLEMGPGDSYLHGEPSAIFILARYAIMLVTLLIASLTGCTNLQPVEMDPETLQEKILDGTAIHEGDEVRVVTRDAVSHMLVVTAVEKNTLRGYAQGAKPGTVVIEIPVEDILILEEEKVNAADTAAGSLGVTAIVIAVAFIIAPSIIAFLL
jgi:hypothetical protein